MGNFPVGLTYIYLRSEFLSGILCFQFLVIFLCMLHGKWIFYLVHIGSRVHPASLRVLGSFPGSYSVETWNLLLSFI
jgi:hypothetical protein